VSFDDRDLVLEEYACEERLRARKRAHKELRQGVDADDVIVAAAAEAAPAHTLEVGCRLGELAERIAAMLGCHVVALDLSPRMVELARGRGVDARVGDARALPTQEAIRAYVATTIAGRGLAERVTALSVPFRTASDQGVYVATKAA
jgi:ubiquinone/menaquinone biosynthesis C-methylase UbiE